MLRKAKGTTAPVSAEDNRLLGGFDADDDEPAAKKAQQQRTARIVYVAASVDSMDAQLLPSVFQALEADPAFLLSPASLGKLALCQSLAQSLASPAWGLAADTKPRSRLLAVGCAGWGLCTLLVGAAPGFYALALGRACAGVALACIMPLSQSILADLFPDAERGRAFGACQAFQQAGALFGASFATSVSHRVFRLPFALPFVPAAAAVAGQMGGGWSLAGWRVPFLASGCMSLGLAAFIRAQMREPPRGVTSPAVLAANREARRQQKQASTAAAAAAAGGVDGSSSSSSSSSSSNSGGGTERHAGGKKHVSDDQDDDCNSAAAGAAAADAAVEEKVTLRRAWAGVMGNTTFWLIAGQGLFGAVPWSALAFATMWLQYVGFSDVQASSAFSCFMLGAGMGGPLGGAIGDWAASKSRDRGRVYVAQASVLGGLPFVWLIFELAPRPPEQQALLAAAGGGAAAAVGADGQAAQLSAPLAYHLGYAGLFFLFGLCCSWCAPATNRPILSEVVQPRLRATLLASLLAIEGSTAALFGAPLVGYLAESVFGYRTTTGRTVASLPPAHRAENAAALGRAIVWIGGVCWVFCFCVYGLVHGVYARDRDAAKFGPAGSAAAKAARAAEAAKAAKAAQHATTADDDLELGGVEMAARLRLAQEAV
jgi:MFS family permease